MEKTDTVHIRSMEWGSDIITTEMKTKMDTRSTVHSTPTRDTAHIANGIEFRGGVIDMRKVKF